jgi:DNA-binding NarL/FixJ family response regulator
VVRRGGRVAFLVLDTVSTLAGGSWWPERPGALAWALLVAQGLACLSLVLNRMPLVPVAVIAAFTLAVTLLASPGHALHPVHGNTVWAPFAATKSTPPEDLIGLVRVAVEGHTVLSPSAARRLLAASGDRLSTRERARELTRSLTEREVEVLGCLGEGLSNAQIAARLYLSEATVKGYVSRMLDKLGCANRTQAGLIAHDAGLVGG